MPRHKQPKPLESHVLSVLSDMVIDAANAHFNTCNRCRDMPVRCQWLRHGITELADSSKPMHKLLKSTVDLWQNKRSVGVTEYKKSIVSFLIYRVFNRKNSYPWSYEVMHRTDLDLVKIFEKKLIILKLHCQNFRMTPKQFRTPMWRRTVVKRVVGSKLTIIDFGWGYARDTVITRIMRMCVQLKEIRQVSIKNPGERLFFPKCIWKDYPNCKSRYKCTKIIEVIEFSYPKRQKHRKKYFEGWYRMIRFMPKLKSLGAQFSANSLIKYFERRGIDNINIPRDNKISTTKELMITKPKMEKVITKFPNLKDIILLKPFFEALEVLHTMKKLQHLTIYGENIVSFDHLLKAGKKWSVLTKLRVYDCGVFNFSVFKKICPVLKDLDVKCNVVTTSQNTFPFVHLEVAKVEYNTSENLEWLPMLSNVKNLNIQCKNPLFPLNDSNLRSGFLHRFMNVTFPHLQELSLGVRLSHNEIVQVLNSSPVLQKFPQPYAIEASTRQLQHTLNNANWDVQLVC